MYTYKFLREQNDCFAYINNKWVPSRPLVWDFGCPFSLRRLKDAWEVFRGRADAFTWPEGQ